MACFDPRSADEEKHAREGMAVACELMTWLEEIGVSLDTVPTNAREWWAKHQRRDAQPVLVKCTECNGTGRFHDSDAMACAACLGTGWRT